MDTVLRHHLGLRKLIASTTALGDDQGLVVAARIIDPGASVEIEIRFGTLAQIEALLAAVLQAREALSEGAVLIRDAAPADQPANLLSRPQGLLSASGLHSRSRRPRG